MDTIKDFYELHSGGPKYRALVEALRAGVAADTLVAGQRLPPVRELAWQLGITPGTVARAYTILTEQGLLRAEVGRGTFVADQSAEARADRHITLLGHPTEWSDMANLFYSRPPDVGQVSLINQALRRVSDGVRPSMMDYPSPAAYRPTREGALRWVESAVLGPTSSDDVVLTQGGQSGVVMVMQAVLRGPAPVILVEELSYPGFRRAAELLRAKVVAVPMDDDGLLPEALDELVQRHDAQLLCTSAEAHNPTSRFTPAHRREAIAEVAGRRGLNILEDDCYRLAPSRAPSYRSMLPQLGWYVTSLSKSLTPSLRFGFVIAPERQSTRLARVAEHGFFGLSEPLAQLMADLLSLPETYEVAARVRAETQRYVRAGVNGLGGFDLSWNEDVPFLWVTLPQGWRAGSFVRAAEERGVKLRSGEMFVPRDAAVPSAVRLAANAQLPLASFEQALTTLRGLLDNPREEMAN